MAEENKSVPVKEKENKMDSEKEKKVVETKVAPEGVPRAQVASAKADELGKEKKVEGKKKKNEIKVKDVAIANGFGLKISPKQCKYVCRVIRGKSPEAAVARLQSVIDEKRPVPMAGLEVGHKKGKGLSGAKFPKNASKGVMEIVKQAGANAVVAGIENPVISIAKSDQAPAPYRRAGRKAKRTHIHIEIRDKTKVVGRRSKAGGAK